MKIIPAVCAASLPLALFFSQAAPAGAEPKAVSVAARKAVAQARPGATVPPAPPASPAIAFVAVIVPRTEVRPELIQAQGYVMPWQESHVGSEVGGLRLVSVLANVGDVVKKGQVLALLDAATVEAELDAAKAQLVEAEAALAQATATLARAKRLAPTGGISQQDLTLYETQQQTAAARRDAARAQVKKQQLRLGFATLVAPDDGIISSRSAVEGAIVQAGGELFRLIRQARLEWRPEVNGDLLLKVKPGQHVTVHSPLGERIDGKVRQVSPTIDRASGRGTVYVDLPAENDLKAGLMVSGTLEIGKRRALAVPNTAVFQEGGRYQIFAVAPDNRLAAVEIVKGREMDGWVEISSGLEPDMAVVATGVKGLKAGDVVQTAEPSRSTEADERTVSPLPSAEPTPTDT